LGHPIENAPGVVEIGDKWGRHYRILTPNKLGLSFLAPNDCVKVSSNSVQNCDHKSNDRQADSDHRCYATAMGQIMVK